jgi:hypothetical protein
VTHVRLDGGDGALHVFLTNSKWLISKVSLGEVLWRQAETSDNSVITVSESKSLAHTTLVSQGLRANPAPSDDWDEGNAATVLWSVIQAGELHGPTWRLPLTWPSVAKSFIQESLKPPSMDCSVSLGYDGQTNADVPAGCPRRHLV